MKKLLIASGIILFFGHCKSEGWTDAQKDKLRKTCTDPMEGKIDLKTATKYCDCVIEQAMKKYKSYDELDKKGTEEEGRQMGMNCIGELKPGMDKGAGGENMTDSTK
jgi:hypothetical protein